MMSVPVMSEGIRSGVNWMRLNTRPSVCASVRTSSVLAVPGKPVIRQWPPTNSAIITCSITSSCPTITLRTSRTMLSLNLLETVDPFLEFRGIGDGCGWSGHV